MVYTNGIAPSNGETTPSGEEEKTAAVAVYEEPIEGEFREVPTGEPSVEFRETYGEDAPFTEEELREFQEKQAYGERVEGWELGREEEKHRGRLEKHIKLKAEVERKKGEAELAKLKAEGRFFKARARPGIGKTASRILKIATLGGPPKFVRKELYLPMKKVVGTYIPTGMRRLTTPGSLGGYKMPSLARASEPQLERLQRLTSLAAGGASPLSRVVMPSRRLTAPPRFASRATKDVITSTKMRELMLPRGLSPIERMAYVEIKGNNDIDTRSHVVSELMGMGVSKSEALRAVESLLRKRVIRQDRAFEGEPLLEVAR